jgi:hypothetical protein
MLAGLRAASLEFLCNAYLPVALCPTLLRFQNSVNVNIERVSIPRSENLQSSSMLLLHRLGLLVRAQLSVDQTIWRPPENNSQNFATRNAGPDDE